ncbi:hypothetical protein CAEBREN_10480 [Caenorhabditis brenneri]|uniref:Uncharacterized protein n=1 Tax=Caenorhabditis brenneri TaxID=135651 RepID=G0N872_CAEBE|nr:hypothetical protein CAEBREN_10480 [Caenorhabditis brenneri]
MPTAVTVGESVKTNKRFTVKSPIYREDSNESDEERGDSEDEEYEPVDHGVGKDEESEEDEVSPKIESKKNEARKSIKKNSKKRKSSRPKHERKEKKRSPPAFFPAQDEGPSTSGPPPMISRSSSFSSTSKQSDEEEEPPSRNLPVEGTVNEGCGPAAPNREMEDVLRENHRENPEEGAGPLAHQFGPVAQDRQPDQELHDDRLGEERPVPEEEGPEDLEEDQAAAASPVPQEEVANQVVQDQGLQPLEWLEQYRGAQLFEGHPPHQEHARIREEDVPVLQQEMPRELVELHREDDLLLAQLAHGAEMPQLRPEDLDLLEDNGRRQEHDGVHQDHGALNPQDQFEVFEDNEQVHQAEDVLQEGGVRWPGEVSLHKYLSGSGPLLPEEYFEIEGEM